MVEEKILDEEIDEISEDDYKLIGNESEDELFVEIDDRKLQIDTSLLDDLVEREQKKRKERKNSELIEKANSQLVESSAPEEPELEIDFESFTWLFETIFAFVNTALEKSKIRKLDESEQRELQEAIMKVVSKEIGDELGAAGKIAKKLVAKSSYFELIQKLIKIIMPRLMERLFKGDGSGLSTYQV